MLVDTKNTLHNITIRINAITELPGDCGGADWGLGTGRGRVGLARLAAGQELTRTHDHAPPYRNINRKLQEHKSQLLIYNDIY